MAYARSPSFNEAEPTNQGKECVICFTLVISQKVLSCGHEMCRGCAEKVIQQLKESRKTSYPCHECRTPTSIQKGINGLRTRYYGLIQCGFCLNEKPNDDMWWCPCCVKCICSKCAFTEHKKRDHSLVEWNTFRPVDDCRKYLTIALTDSDKKVSKGARKLIQQHFNQTMELILGEVTGKKYLSQLLENMETAYGSTADIPDATVESDKDSEYIASINEVLKLAGKESFLNQRILPEHALNAIKTAINRCPPEQLALKFLDKQSSTSAAYIEKNLALSGHEAANSSQPTAKTKTQCKCCDLQALKPNSWVSFPEDCPDAIFENDVKLRIGGCHRILLFSKKAWFVFGVTRDVHSTKRLMGLRLIESCTTPPGNIVDCCMRTWEDLIGTVSEVFVLSEWDENKVFFENYRILNNSKSRRQYDDLNIKPYNKVRMVPVVDSTGVFIAEPAENENGIPDRVKIHKYTVGLDTSPVVPMWPQKTRLMNPVAEIRPATSFETMEFGSISAGRVLIPHKQVNQSGAVKSSSVNEVIAVATNRKVIIKTMNLSRFITATFSLIFEQPPCADILLSLPIPHNDDIELFLLYEAGSYLLSIRELCIQNGTIQRGLGGDFTLQGQPDLRSCEGRYGLNSLYSSHLPDVSVAELLLFNAHGKNLQQYIFDDCETTYIPVV